MDVVIPSQRVSGCASIVSDKKPLETFICSNNNNCHIMHLTSKITLPLMQRQLVCVFVWMWCSSATKKNPALKRCIYFPCTPQHLPFSPQAVSEQKQQLEIPSSKMRKTFNFCFKYQHLVFIIWEFFDVLVWPLLCECVCAMWDFITAIKLN